MCYLVLDITVIAYIWKNIEQEMKYGSGHERKGSAWVKTDSECQGKPMHEVLYS